MTRPSVSAAGLQSSTAPSQLFGRPTGDVIGNFDGPAATPGGIARPWAGSWPGCRGTRRACRRVPGVLAIVYRAGSFSCDGGGSWLRCCRLPPGRVEASDLTVDGSAGCGSFPGSAGSGLGVNYRRRTGPDHLGWFRTRWWACGHVMSCHGFSLAAALGRRPWRAPLLTGLDSRSSAPSPPAHSFHPGEGGQGHRIPQNGARQDRAGQVHSRGPVPVAADIGSDTAERSAWHCPPLMTRMSTGNRDPVTARRRRSRVADRMGPGRRP